MALKGDLEHTVVCMHVKSNKCLLLNLEHTLVS
jgi:hypothetical protein